MHTAHRIIAAVVSAPILLIPAAALANADAPPGKGANGGAETNDTGKPVNPNGFGAVVSQLATGLGGIGEPHLSLRPRSARRQARPWRCHRTPRRRQRVPQ